MPYTIVDRNLLIPKIETKDEFFDGLEELHKKTYLRSKEYNKNVYMVQYSGVRFEGIIKSDGEKIYEVDSDDNIIRYIEVDYSYLYIKKTSHNNLSGSSNQINPDSKSITNLTTDLSIVCKKNEDNNKCSIIKNVKIDCENLDNMDININSNKASSVLIDDSDKLLIKNDSENKISKEKEDKKNELLKMCEQVMDMYNLELNKIKKTELNLLSIDNKIKKLLNKKREKIFENITRTKDEYETWKKIKYDIPKDNQSMVILPESELELRENPVIPILFVAKYNYIEKILENEQIKEIFTTLNKINLAELYVKDEIDLDPKIIKFVEKYTDISKKDLHYKFEHDWDYLDNEFEQVENNHFTSKKTIEA